MDFLFFQNKRNTESEADLPGDKISKQFLFLLLREEKRGEEKA